MNDPNEESWREIIRKHLPPKHECHWVDYGDGRAWCDICGEFKHPANAADGVDWYCPEEDIEKEDD